MQNIEYSVITSGVIKSFDCSTYYTFTLCIVMDFSIQIDTIRMGLYIIYFKGSHVGISKL